MSTHIYLDNSMTTRPSEKSVSAMMPYLREKWGNPSAPHQKGQEVVPGIAESLKSIYKLFGAEDSDSFVFTSSGAEAVNQAIFSTYYDLTRKTGKNQFITSQVDEAPAIMSIGHLESLGCVGKLVNPDKNGRVTVEHLKESITPRTAMISLSWANGLTGVIQPIQEIAVLCKERGIRLHVDATHVLGKLYLQFHDIGAHLVSFNGDHLHAPKGSGGLYVHKDVAITPYIFGGLEQAGMRAGTINMPALAGLGIAAAESLDARDYVCTEVARLRDLLEQGISKAIPEAIIFFKDVERLPHCTTIAFPGVVNEALLFALNRKQLFASIGGGSFQQISLLLTACGIDERLANSAISFSLSRETTDFEIEKAIEIIKEAVQKLRKISKGIA